MFQQIIALVVIFYFLSRLFWQKRKKQISGNEFVFWLIFWMTAAVAILLLKWLDRLVASLGFSGSGIEVMFYVGVVLLFYFVFRLRLRLEKIEKDITEIVKNTAIFNLINKKK